MTADERRRRLRDIKAVDETALDLVYESLADEDPGVRREAIRLIARSAPSPGLLLTLEKALTDDKELARRSAAMEALAAMGKSALMLLTRLTGDPRAGVRRLAVDALGLSRMPESIEVLEKAARDPQPAVRSAALEAVARTGASRAPSVLIRAVEDRTEVPAVVLAALLGLLQLNKTPAAHILRRLVDDALTAPPALRLLGRAGEAAFLVDALVTHTASRQRAAVLGLAEALETHPAPGRLRSRESVDALHKLVESADVQVACAALVVAAHAGDVGALVQAAARDDRAHLSSAAHRALNVLGQSRSDLPETLRMLVADDAPGAELVLELADAAERARARLRSPRPSGTARLDDRSFARLARLVEQLSGIAITDDARVRLEARLLPRVEDTGCGDFASYVELLAGRGDDSRAELLRALDLITIHETYFFRERAQLDAFRDDVLPGMAARAGAGGLRLWSAGCSTGEEAYTLGILLEEAGVQAWEVLGTDLSTTSLDVARSGRFTPRSFRGEIDQRIRRKWFIYELGGVHVHPDLRKKARFEVLNLVDEPAVTALPLFDVIFCRNVLIYMSPPARARVIDQFWRRLKPGGLLMLGHSESLLHVDTPFKLRPLQRALAYEKAPSP